MLYTPSVDIIWSLTCLKHFKGFSWKTSWTFSFLTIFMHVKLINNILFLCTCDWLLTYIIRWYSQSYEKRMFCYFRNLVILLKVIICVLVRWCQYYCAYECIDMVWKAMIGGLPKGEKLICLNYYMWHRKIQYLQNKQVVIETLINSVEKPLNGNTEQHAWSTTRKEDFPSRSTLSVLEISAFFRWLLRNVGICDSFPRHFCLALGLLHFWPTLFSSCPLWNLIVWWFSLKAGI